jgi:hypothetical protein
MVISFEKSIKFRSISTNNNVRRCFNSTLCNCWFSTKYWYKKNLFFFFLNKKIFFLAVRETQQVRAEIITTLAIADRLYSEVEENVPDPSPLTANRKEIEIILEQVRFIIFFLTNQDRDWWILILHPFGFRSDGVRVLLDGL